MTIRQNGRNVLDLAAMKRQRPSFSLDASNPDEPLYDVKAPADLSVEDLAELHRLGELLLPFDGLSTAEMSAEQLRAFKEIVDRQVRAITFPADHPNQYVVKLDDEALGKLSLTDKVAVAGFFTGKLAGSPLTVPPRTTASSRFRTSTGD